MSFTANFWTFSKKPNSTKIPTSTGDTLTCHANADVDVLRPTFYVKASLASTTLTAYNYVQIPSFSRYYWIDGWSVENGLWVCSCHVDPLASWKSSILSQSLYVLRSASDYNGLLTDGMYGMTGEYSVDKQTSVSPWASGLVSRFNGRFVVGITGTTAVQYYLMTWTQFQTFMFGLFSDNYVTSVLQEMYLDTTYPEAKIAVNPIQYLSSIVYIPYAIPTASLNQVTAVRVGFGEVAAEAYEFTYSSTITVGDDIDFNVHLHPQGTSRGAYLNRPPYTDYRLFFPPWGMVTLDGNIVARAASIRCRWYVDCHTGQGGLNVYSVRDGAETMICHLIGQIGVSYAVGQTFEPGLGLGYTLEGFGRWVGNIISAAMQSNPFGVIGTYAQEWREMNIESSIPQHSSTGTYGGYAGLAGGPVELLTTHKLVTAEDLAQFGRPLYEVRTLSTLSGFVVCKDADIAIPAYAAEISEIQRALLGGLFLE